MIIKKCPQCGKEFKAKYSKRKFCSQECLKESKLYDVICFTCGAEFKARTRMAKYCSTACKNQQKTLGSTDDIKIDPKWLKGPSMRH